MVSPNLHRRRLVCGLSFALLIAASGSAAGAAAVPAAAQPSSGVMARQSVPSGNLIDALARVLHLDRVVVYLRGILPDAQLVYDWSPDDPSQWPGREDASTGGGGLFGDDQDSSFLWGGSTLEVVRTSAMYMTRPANFGPRITVDEGLRGSLIPIAEFYSPPSSSKLKLGTKRLPDNTACPYPGGPGWHDDGNEGPKVSFTKAPRGVRPPEDWIALVERGGNCSFAAKVRVSMALGAKAVVVGDAPNPNWKGSDDPSDNSDPGLTNKRPLTMFAPGDTSDVNITSTFVTRPSYLDLLRLVDEVEAERRVANRPSRADSSKDKRGLEIVLARNDISWEWPLIDLALLLLLLPSVMTVASIIVHRIRVARQRRKDRAPETVVLALPCLIWRSDGQPWEKATGKDDGDLNFSSSKASHADSSGSDTAGEASRAGPSSGSGPPRVSVAPAAPGSSHAFLPAGRAYYGSECTICLSDFQDGDRVRVLPCGHIFHRSEIDDWLIRIRKTCPLCSRDCTVAVPPMPIIAQDVQPEIGAGAGASAVLESVVVDEQAGEVAPADERTPLLDSRTRS